MREAGIDRKTKETSVKLELNVDGSGKADIATGLAFFDHMLELFAKHGLFDLTVAAAGDLDVDAHHTVEDVGICLGRALDDAIGEKTGLRRYGDCSVPMDEALVMAAVDFSGRPYLAYQVDLPVELIGSYDTTLTEEFLRAVAANAKATMHFRSLGGRNAHHITEAVFKAAARAIDLATQVDDRVSGVPSTKGSL